MKLGSVAILACLALLALPSVALGSTRHFQGTVTTDPEHPPLKFDVKGRKKHGKFVPRRVLNLIVTQEILYQGGCAKCVPPFRYPFCGYCVTQPPGIEVIQKGKQKGTFLGEDDNTVGDTTISIYIFFGKFKSGTKASGELTAAVSEAGIQFAHGKAQHRWKAHRVP